jgi:uncharacterized alpha-E superfamily protein
MLSRVAESLYWAARYVERAEDVTRLLDVHFHALLDRQVPDRGESWQRLVTLLGDEPAYLEHFDEHTAESVSEWVLWHRGNPNSVVSCIEVARENARSVREQISAEMWQAVNKLFLLVRATGRHAVAPGPHAFYEQLRSHAHQFYGAADATMEHGESYEFVRLGLHLERAEKTTRIVGARYPVAAGRDEDDPARPRMLIDLLRSCGAFEAYARRHGMVLEPLMVAEELVRSGDSPRSVLHCLRNCRHAAEAIGGENRVVRRLLGRLCADIEFGEQEDASGPAVAAAMGGLLTGINSVGEAVTRAYFSNRALSVVAQAAQEVQQQQCG